MSYYEKTGDYQSIVSMFIAIPAQMPNDIAQNAALICDRAPQEAFDTVEFLAAIHLSAYMHQGLWQKTIELAEYYEARYIKLTPDDYFRRRALSSIYYCWAITRGSMCLTDDNYDFDLIFEKFDKCFSKPVDPVKLISTCPGPWICVVGSSRKGAMEEFIGAVNRSTEYMSHCFDGFQIGEDTLAHGELKFYQNDTSAAEQYIIRALSMAREKKQFELEHRALFYILRIAVSQGNYPKAVQAIEELKAQLDENEYLHRFINYDISLSWYYCTLSLAEQIPDWLKENFEPYSYAGFIENFANQMKARFCYSTRNYTPLLSYIEEMKQRESFLFGRIEMLAIEACVHYRMKNKPAAFAALTEAYETALSNDILMPFIELGKDMRTLTGAALKKTDITIPGPWLENIYRKSASYARRQAHIITEYRHANRMVDDIYISPREAEILANLSKGFSRAEIAAGLNLSVNTVKMVINNIYSKLGAENLPDLIRIAMERKRI
jgi:LuxR family maltose regulon positive regulatory protein